MGTADPDDPKVRRLWGQIGRVYSEMPKPMIGYCTQRAFANSDFAFQGQPLFQGNFYA